MQQLTPEEQFIRDFVAKIVIVGDTGTGKSVLLDQFKINYPTPNLNVFLGGSRTVNDHNKNKVLVCNKDERLRYAETQMKLSTKDKVKVMVVDPPGAPELRNVFLPALAGKNGAVVMYDITNLESYLNARTWIKLVKSKSGGNVVISLVGNKLDLADDDDKREVQRG